VVQITIVGTILRTISPKLRLKGMNPLLNLRILHLLLVVVKLLGLKEIHLALMKIKKLLQNNLRYSLFFPFILSQFDSENLNKAEPIVAFTFNMFILNLSCLFCFINITGYLLSLYFINKYKDKLETKNPSPLLLIVKKLINFYSKTSMFWIKFEIVMAFILLLFMLIANFAVFYMYYKLSIET